MSKVRVRLPKVTCRRCGHKWLPRVSVVLTCAKCKSTKWDQPKK